MTLSAQNLTFFYEKQLPVLEKVSFSVEKGQFVGIFGPNGGGKTTLLKLLLGLLHANSGSISVLGQNPRNTSHRVGYVPQVRRFDKQFPITVMEVVLQGCLADYKGFGSFSKEAKNNAFDALKQVDLENKADAPFGILSGGQIQRTLIARALASRPDILLLDEATVGIDPKVLKDIFQFLVSLKGKITVLMVTHDLHLMAREMDQLLCVNKTLSPYSYKQVCEHFAMGLYHD